MPTDGFEAHGTVEHAAHDVFRVALDSGQTVLARRSGRMNRNRIRVLVGDRVAVELGRFDPARGRIVRRFH